MGLSRIVFVCIVLLCFHCSLICSENTPQLGGFALTLGAESLGLLGEGSSDLILNGNLMNKWKSCLSDTDLTSIEKYQSSCYVADGSLFRTVFSFYYEDMPLFVAEPVVKSSNAKINAEVEFFDNDQVEQSGEFSIIFDCPYAAAGQSTLITVTVEDVDWGNEEMIEEQWNGGNDAEEFVDSSQDSMAIAFSFSFVKVCGKGDLDHVVMKMLKSSDDTEGSDEVDVPLSAQGQQEEIKVLQTTKVSKFLVSIEEPLRYLFVEPPKLKVFENKAVDVSLRGALAHGGAIENWDRADLVLIYHCLEQKSTKIEVELPIPPFNSKKVVFTKECGALDAFAHEEGFLDLEEESKANEQQQPNTEQDRTIIPMIDRLRIGSSDFYDADVFSDSKAATKYDLVKYDMLSSSSPALDIMKYSVLQSEVDFYVWNSDPAQKLSYDVLEVTVGSPSVVRAYFAGVTPGNVYQNYLGEQNGVINEQMKRMKIHMVCRTQGTSKILVTMLLKTGRTAEFGFLKECNAPKKIKKRAFLRTAGSLFTVIVMSFISLAAFLIYKYAKQVRHAVHEYNRVRAR